MVWRLRFPSITPGIEALRTYIPVSTHQARPVSISRDQRPFLSTQRAMTTSPTKIHISPSHTPYFAVPNLRPESAAKASELLQRNHEDFHIFFNDAGFHDHITHHLLTLYALGASTSTLQTAFDSNASYQRRLPSASPSIITDLHDRSRFTTYLGKGKHYSDFLAFFTQQIEEKGWEDVLREYLLADDQVARRMHARLYESLLHPLIHLGCGVEFGLGGVVAEALAQTAVHPVSLTRFFEVCETTKNVVPGGKAKGIVELLRQMRADEGLKGAIKWGDGGIGLGGGRVLREKVGVYAGRYVVSEEDDLEEKAAEMLDAAAYMTTTAQRPPHLPALDFFLLHTLTSALFTALLVSPSTTFLTVPAKCHILTHKVRVDMLTYASLGCPALYTSSLTDYTPAHPDAADWAGVFRRAMAQEDDGHLVKTIRALAAGEQVCGKYEGKEGFTMQGEMWVKAGNLAVDSVQRGADWVRGAGWEEAWRGM